MDDKIELYDFLPKYPDSKSNYGYNDKLNENIYLKKEFNDLKLDTHEELKNQGELLNHQKFLSRFICDKTNYNDILLYHEMGCLSPDTFVLKWDGSVRQAKNIQEGDYLINECGEKQKVLKIYDGVSNLVRVNQKFGESYVVNENHILTLKVLDRLKINDHDETYNTVDILNIKTLKWEKKIIEKTYINSLEDLISSEDSVIDIPVKEYFMLDDNLKKHLHSVKNSCINWKRKDVPLNPFIFGSVLFDEVENITQNIAKTKIDTIIEDSFNSTNNIIADMLRRNCDMNLDNIDEDISSSEDEMESFISSIPDYYIINDIENRLLLLSGIFDRYGYYSIKENTITVKSKNIFILYQLYFVASSCGFTAYVVKNTDNYNLYLRGDLNSLSIESIDVSDCSHDNDHNPVSVRYETNGQYIGWTLDTSQNMSSRFLLGDFTITHNSGKTCTSVAIIENMREVKDRALVIMKSDDLIRNYKNEITTRCTIGKYDPDEELQIDENEEEDIDEITDEIKKRQVNKKIKKYYDFQTTYAFKDFIAKKSDDYIRKHYSNRVIVIDEVHNLLSDSVYKEYHRFLHLVSDCKIILMTGTPMRHNIYEIALVMNLITPMGNQIETGPDFMSKYCKEIDSNLSLETFKPYEINQQTIDQFLEKIKGKISYLKNMPNTQIELNYGDHDKQIRICNMQGTQLAGYKKSKTEDENSKDTQTNDVTSDNDEDKKNGFYINQRKASTFVFPDGTWSKDWKNKTEKNILITQIRKFITENGTDYDSKIKQLSQLSCKFATAIDIIFRNSNMIHFVYSEFVKNGIVLFYEILKMFDITKVALLVSTNTSAQNRRLINAINSPENKYGELINVVLASPFIKEGFSFKNIQSEILLSAEWSDSVTQQIIYRGIRLGSHNDLLVSPDDKVTVNIYKLCANDESNGHVDIDEYMYDVSRLKKSNIIQMENLLKTDAIDCALNWKRNSAYDDNYDCRNIDTTLYKSVDSNTPLDMITFDIYYNESTIETILSIIKTIFDKNNSITYEKLKQRVIQVHPYITDFMLLTALTNIILYNTNISNNNSTILYLREENEIYFTVRYISSVSRYSLYYDDILLQTITSTPTLSAASDDIKDLCSKKDKDEIIKKLKDINNTKITFTVLKICIYLKYVNKIEHIEFINNMLEIYDIYYFTDFSSDIYVVYLKDTLKDTKTIKEPVVEKLDMQTSEWEVVNTADFKQILVSSKFIESLEKYEYYGIMDDLKFKIKKISKVQQQKNSTEIDKRTANRGQDCGTIKDVINYIFKFIMNLRGKTNGKRLNAAILKIIENNQIQLVAAFKDNKKDSKTKYDDFNEEINIITSLDANMSRLVKLKKIVDGDVSIDMKKESDIETLKLKFILHMIKSKNELCRLAEILFRSQNKLISLAMETIIST